MGVGLAQLDDVLSSIDANQGAAVDRLMELLRIPSVSAQPDHFPDCERAADWLTQDLASIGFAAEKKPTPGRPIVVATAKARTRNAPHVLFYGHYDVQPVDPVNLWKSPPFEPALTDGPLGKRIVARGSSDDKGQLMTFLEACRAFRANGGLPCDVTVLFEGEEETGSPSLPKFLDDNAKALKADVALVCDTSMWDAKTPAITTMLRGLVSAELTLTGPERDLHSGLYGGPAINPIRVLSRIIADLHDDQGHVTLPGFYDGVEELPEEIKEGWDALGFDTGAFLRAVGLSVPAGERGRSGLEMLWARPTCEVNGIYGGYQGEGPKTVIPSKATAKFTFRLVGKQNPERIAAAFQNFVRERLPSDVEAEFKPGGGSPALQLPTRNEALKRTRRALEAEWGKPAAMIGAGGSIPVVGLFKTALGMDSLMVGFALDDDSIHAPNEKYELNSFRKGARSWARILAAIAE